MKRPTIEEQRQLVRQWEDTGRELQQIREDALRDKPYNWKEVDDLLSLGEDYDGPPRLTSGLEEMQAVFMKAAPAWYLEERAKRLQQHDDSS